jgi:stage V sporulation protein AA
MVIIYLNAFKKVDITSTKDIYIKDIASLEGPKNIVNELYSIKVMKIKESKNKNYLLSIIDIIEHIRNYNKDIVINNLGESNIIVSYKEKAKDENKFFTIVKIIFVCMTLLSGGAVAIMTFHTDTSLPDVFRQLYYVFLGDRDMEKYHLVEIPYAIGLATGIIVFFNHFSSLKLTEDPTPIEVEMKLYERDVDDCIIETLIDEDDNNDN